MSSCPTLADLLCAMEDDPSPSIQDDETRRHAASCPACRTSLRSFDALVAAGRVHVLMDACDDDQRRVARFRRRLDDERRADAETGSRSRWWWVAAVILPLYIVSLAQARLSETRVSPEHLVTEAARMEGAASADLARRVRIEFKPERHASQAPGLWLVRNITSPGGWPPQEPSGTLRRVVEALHTQRVEGAPLSAAAFAAWRRGAPNRRDRVTVTADLWTLRSEGGAGESVRSAELMISRTSYRVVGQVWVLDRWGRLEITELARWTPDRAPVAASRAGPDATPESIGVDGLEAAELRARGVLHDLQLDDALRIAQRGERVSVIGSLASVEQRRALTNALRAVPAVSLTLRAGGAPTTAAATPDLRVWVARRFDDLAAREAFAPRLRQLAQSVRRRAMALDLFAQRYSQAAARHLSADMQAQVERLADRHVEALHRDLVGLDAYFMALTGPTNRCALGSLTPRDWRARAADARPRVERAIDEIEALLTADDLPSEPAWKARATGAFAGAWNAWCHPRMGPGTVTAEPR